MAVPMTMKQHRADLVALQTQHDRIASDLLKNHFDYDAIKIIETKREIAKLAQSIKRKERYVRELEKKKENREVKSATKGL